MKWMMSILILLPFYCIAARPDSISISDRPVKHGYTNLVGPRLGVSIITGEAANKLKDNFNIAPIVTQFGWQWETRFLTVEGGVSGISEFTLLVEGVEQGVFLPSLSMTMGFRSRQGGQFCIGPNISMTGVSYSFGFGVTSKQGKINIPVNFSIALSKKGFRFSFLFGFSTEKD